MMGGKLLITLRENDVAPRFDLTTEVLLDSGGAAGEAGGQKTLVLPRASAEELCHLILAEEVRTVVCGAIEEEYYQYLTWKKIAVIDSVMGPWKKALERYMKGCLQPGDILHHRLEYTHHDQFSQ
jgi:hypothetical protein